MQKVVTAAEMRELDRQTSEKYGISSIILMENAAHAAARVIIEVLGGCASDKSILVLCGPGNNGGDGAAAARILWQEGADVEVCLFGRVSETSGDARTNLEILERISNAEGLELTQSDLAFEEITSLDEWLEYDSVNFHCDDPDVIVDALFGTGLKRPLEGICEQVTAYIDAFSENRDASETLVISLDLPSGLEADNPLRIGLCARANQTVTFTAPKPANVLPPASTFNGGLHVAHIGTPCELIAQTRSQLYLAEIQDAIDWLARTEFSSDSYKNLRGHAMIIAGSSSYTGAAVLCGNSAIRSGVGLVTLAVPESSHTSIASRVSPEVIVRPVSATTRGTIGEKAYDELSGLFDGVDVVAIGSGLSSGDISTKKFVTKVVENRQTPVVIDADGLNALSPFKLKGSVERPLILTPHEGEFCRLLGLKGKEKVEDRVEACRNFSVKHNVILLLKGERALISDPDGRVVINPTGNSGLGKAGNGDTLMGILAGFLAQAVKFHVDIFETVVAAVYIAGVAGDIAEEKYGRRVMTASDVRESLTEAIDRIQVCENYEGQ
ncbi:MAG: NAD(P)H-hydrate dehydratase [Pyrinomonadaceae bacterium]